MLFEIKFNPRGGIFHCNEIIDQNGRVVDSFGTYARAEEAVRALKYGAERLLKVTRAA